MKRNHKLYLTLISALGLSTTAFAQDAQAAMSNTITVNSDLVLLGVLAGMAIILLLVVNYLAKTLKSLTANEQWVRDAVSRNATAKTIVGFVGLSLLTHSASAAEAVQDTSAFVMPDGLFWALVSINALLLSVVIFLFVTIKNVINILSGKAATEAVADEPVTAYDKIIHSLTDSVPLEREHEVLTDHDYDGIKELDNNLPPWWVYGFYLTILFAVIYMGYYHVFNAGDLQIAEYEQEMQVAKEQKEAYAALMQNNIDENNVELLTDASKLTSGKEKFIANCAACHGNEGQGGVGPNLTDEYWIHGGSTSDIYKTIKHGVPAKGMISWEAQFSPSQIQEIASYIQTLVGTTPPNPKEPQGELYTPAKTNEEQPAPAPEELNKTEDVQQAGM